MTENIRKWLEGEGFPLEMRTAAAFRSAGFEVRQSSFYVDAESGKGREIDVVATDPDTLGLVQIHVVIECKSGKTPWVLLTSEDALSGYNRLLSLGVLSEDARSSIANRAGELMDSLPWFNKSSRNGYALRKVLGGDSDVGYAAAMSVAKACQYIVRRPDAEWTAPFILTFPVIVVDTPLFECILDPDGHLRLEQIPQGEFLFIAKLPHDFGACIRVVTQDHIPAFAQEARTAASKFRAALKPDEEKRMTTWPKS